MSINPLLDDIAQLLGYVVLIVSASFTFSVIFCAVIHQLRNRSGSRGAPDLRAVVGDPFPASPSAVRPLTQSARTRERADARVVGRDQESARTFLPSPLASASRPTTPTGGAA